VAPESGVTILGATFTPDGSFVDFVRQTRNPQWDVWRVPFLGGTPKLLIRRVLSPIGWSADGQHIAYLRGSDQAGTTAIAVADPDGSQERDLATWRPPIVLLTFNAPWLPSIAPAWSADGHTIAIGVVDRSGGSFKTAVNFVDAATGSIRTAPSPGAITYGVAWLDSESLVLDYATDGPTQLWRFAARTGALSRITNDPNNYLGVNFTADRSGLVTARQERYADIWTGDAVASNGSVVAERVASDNVSNLAWMGDRLLFSAFVGGHAAVVGLIPDHGMPEEIAAGAFSNAATPDGSTLLLTLRDVSDNTIALWSADPSGRRRTRLATGLTSMQPVVTPDGHSVIFESFAGGRQSMWIASIAGGETRTLVDEPATSADVSPDGKSLVFFQRGPQGSATVLCDLPACTSRRNLAYFESDAPRRWTPDGRAIAYTIRGNLWIQPIDGAPVRQLSHFTDVRPISNFVWSPGGKRLAIARLTVTNDIVLFKGLKQ